jgi:hypothetical protein
MRLCAQLMSAGIGCLGRNVTGHWSSTVSIFNGSELELLEEVPISAKHGSLAPLSVRSEPRAAGIRLTACYASNCRLAQDLTSVWQRCEPITHMKLCHHSVQQIDVMRHSRKASGNLHDKCSELDIVRRHWTVVPIVA